MNFANNIKSIRKENQLSQEQLAEQLGVSRQSVSKWESGQSYPEMDKILLICKLFDCDINELMNDSIKEVHETRQSKSKTNKTIEDFFNFITRLVDMLMAMNWKQRIKCLLEQLLVAGVLALIGLLIAFVLNAVFNGLFSFLDYAWYYGLRSVLSSVFIIVAVVLGLTILLHIFKIRYLDYYEIVKPDLSKEEDENEEAVEAEEFGAEEDAAEEQEPAPRERKHKFLFSRNREKVIIRDPKHSGAKFLVSVMKAIVLFFKILLGFVGVFFTVSFVGFTALLIVSFLFAKTGLLFIGVFLFLAAVLAINFVTLHLIYNTLTSKKSRKNITALILIISLTVSGIGVGLTAIGCTQFDLIETPFASTKTEYTVSMRDDLYLQCYYVPIQYVETESDAVKIEVTHAEHIQAYFGEYENYIQVSAHNTGSLALLREWIQHINNKEINTYYFDYNGIEDVIVYSSKANIEKLKANDQLHISTEENIQSLYNEIEELLNQNAQLRSQLAEQGLIWGEAEPTSMKDFQEEDFTDTYDAETSITSEIFAEENTVIESTKTVTTMVNATE